QWRFPTHDGQHNGFAGINQQSACGLCRRGRTVQILSIRLTDVGNETAPGLRRLSFALALGAAPATPFPPKNTGRNLVSNEKSNNVIVLDGKTHAVVKDIKTSRRPRDMHFDAAHDKLYVACGDDDVIEIIDVAKLTVVGKLATGSSPEAFVIDEAKRRI